MRISFPDPVTPYRAFAPLCVFSFGMLWLFVFTLRLGGLGGRGALNRREDDAHEPALQLRGLFELRFVLELVIHPLEQVHRQLRVIDLATPEHHRYLDLVALAQQPMDEPFFRLDIVNANLGTETHLAQRVRLLRLPHLPLFGRLKVAELPVVEEPANGWNGIGCDLHQVKVVLTSQLQRFCRRHDAKLPTILVYYADFRHPNAVVDPIFPSYVLYSLTGVINRVSPRDTHTDEYSRIGLWGKEGNQGADWPIRRSLPAISRWMLPRCIAMIKVPHEATNKR